MSCTSSRHPEGWSCDDDEAGDQEGDESGVQRQIEARLRADADRDREETDQRPEQCKRLHAQPGRSS